MQFHVLCFEGPDPYARAGGLATRVTGLTETLAACGFETHLWFIGDPGLPGAERQGQRVLHRWAQWLSRYHPGGVYDAERNKQVEYAASLPPRLVSEHLVPGIRAGGEAAVLAEEWQTVDAVLHLDWLLRRAGVRERVRIFWNANNTFGFERIPWSRLREAAEITTVSRYMKHRMAALGVAALVIPNGLSAEAFERPAPGLLGALRGSARSRTLLTKMARWDPGKRWIGAVEIVAEMKRRGMSPLLVARGGEEPHGREVLEAARRLGLRVEERRWSAPGARGLLDALRGGNGADVVSLCSAVDAEARRLLLRASDAVLANSEHEPFGMVGLETMAVGGIACTGSSGEDYARPGQNALVLETGDPREFIGLFGRLRKDPLEMRALRREARASARRYAWAEVVRGVLLPRLQIPPLLGEGPAPAPRPPRTAPALLPARRPSSPMREATATRRRPA